jgi:hypothetical protein
MERPRGRGDTIPRCLRSLHPLNGRTLSPASTKAEVLSALYDPPPGLIGLDRPGLPPDERRDR